MSSSTVVGTDDLIVHLMSMGFELNDCQDAVTFGKLTVEAAVEWLVAGKPGFKAHSTPPQEGPSLKLRQHNSAFDSTSTAFSKPVPIDEAQSNTSADNVQTQSNVNEPTCNQQGSDQSEANVVSRMHLTDSQRKQKEGFEQKKRDEAKRKAMLEKKRQKEDHDRILKEIAADREKKKLLQTASTKDKTELDTPPVKEQKLETVTLTASSSASSPLTKALLQIRFPDGHSIRQTFDSTCSLQEVWSFIQTHESNLNGYILIQPFPHHEFTEQEMLSTLNDLKLTPSGSLVLQKKKITQQKVEESNETSMDLEDVVPLPPRVPIEGPTCVPPSPDPNHRWGGGNHLNEPSNQEIEVMDEEEVNEDPNMMDPEYNDDQAAMAGMGLPVAFGGGRGRGAGGGGMQFPAPPGNIMGQGNDIFGMQVGPGYQQVFGGVGQRLASDAENQPDAPDQAEGLRLARERALQRAEAEQARLAQQQQQQQRGEPEPGSSSHHLVTSSVQRLLTLCLKHIAHRLNDPRNQLLSLGGISEDMAQIILTYLLKEKMLKPRTLNPFIPCYLRQLILDTYPYTTNELIHSVRLHRNLSHLSLSSCPLITDAGFQDITGMKKLKQLNLSGCRQLTNRCAEVLCSLSSLVSLNLEETGFGDSGVIQYLSSNPEHLVSLNLNRTTVTHAIIPHLYNGAQQLRQLSLENTQVESLLGIDRLNNLESLNVARTGILPESLLCLVQCPALISLNITNTDKINGDTALHNLTDLRLQTLGLPSRHTTTDVGMSHLTCFQLHSLDLTNYIYITDVGVEHIGKITSLQKLLLGNTKITDAGMVFLSGLSRLEVLDLEKTLITDVGAAVLKELKNLIELSLSSTNYIAAAGAPNNGFLVFLSPVQPPHSFLASSCFLTITSRCFVSGALNQCSNLIKLNLSKTAVTSRGIQALTLPFLEMINLDGTKVRPDLTVSMVTECPRLCQMMMRNLVPFTRDDEIEEAEMEVDT